jgi:hypothetical protein
MVANGSVKKRVQELTEAAAGRAIVTEAEAREELKSIAFWANEPGCGGDQREARYLCGLSARPKAQIRPLVHNVASRDFGAGVYTEELRAH